jgi:hypothetical protein
MFLDKIFGTVREAWAKERIRTVWAKHMVEIQASEQES